MLRLAVAGLGGPYEMRHEGRKRHLGADRILAAHVSFRGHARWHYGVSQLPAERPPASLPVRIVIEGSQEYEQIFGPVPIRLTRPTSTCYVDPPPSPRFRAAKKVSEAELRDWEKNLKLEVARSKLKHYIQPQGRDGRLPGLKITKTRRTTRSPSKAQLQRHEKLLQIGLHKLHGIKGLEDLTTAEAIAMTTLFGRGMREAGEMLGKGSKAMQKFRERWLAPRKNAMFGPGFQKAFVESMQRQDRGWFIVVKMEHRPSYLYRLDAPESATAEQRLDAVNRGSELESARMAQAEIERVGSKKLHDERGQLNSRGRQIVQLTEARVRKAFEKGHIIGSFDCNDPGCEMCPPAVVSPIAA
jgi:hypothetical protein